MLDQFIARFRAWQLQLTTIRLLSNTEDRLLADMGLERDDIVAIAKANRVKAEQAISQCQSSPVRARHAAPIPAA